MNNESEKDRLINRLSNLKDNSNFSDLSITDDYTQYQRKTIKEWVAKSNLKIPTKKRKFSICLEDEGNSKNGMFLKKLLKKKPPQQQIQDS